MDDHSTPSGTLAWGIKDSFRNYLSRQADFSLNVADGASVGAGNTVQFQLRQAPADEGIVWAARGQATLRAHGGMMRLSLKNPVVARRGTDLLLSFDFGSEAPGSAPDYFDVARLVELPGGDPRQRTYQSSLLPDATGMFNDMYDVGTELAQVVVTTEAAS